jgi:FHIPEP family
VLTDANLRCRCEAFFDAELAGVRSFGDLLEDAAGSIAVSDEGSQTQLSLHSLYLEGEALSLRRDYLVVLRTTSDSTRYHFLMPDALRAAARESAAGLHMFDVSVGRWDEIDARLSILVYRLQRNRRTDRLLILMGGLVAGADSLLDSHGTTSLANGSFELLEMLRRSRDASLLLGGTVNLPWAAAGNKRYVALVPSQFAPGALSVVDQRLMITESPGTPNPLADCSHVLLHIGKRPEAADVRRYIERLRSEAQMRRQLTNEAGGESYLSYLEKEVGKGRQETIRAMYGGGKSMLPMVTPVVLEAAANLVPIVKFGEDSDTPFKNGLEKMRQEIYGEIGVRMPGVHVRPNDMPDGRYLIMINEIPLVSGTVDIERVLCSATVDELTVQNIRGAEGIHPADGRKASWVDVSHRQTLTEARYETWDASEYVVLHLETVLRKNASQFFGIDEMLRELYRDEAGDNRAQQLVEALRGTVGGLVRFRQTLVALLEEMLTCAPIRTLAERFLEVARPGPAYEVAETLRTIPDINRYLTRDVDDWVIYPFGEDWAKEVLTHLRRDGDAVYVAMPPELTEELLTAVRNQLDSRDRNRRPVVVVDDWKARRLVWRIIELEFPSARVVAKRELDDVDPARLTFGPLISMD